MDSDHNPVGSLSQVDPSRPEDAPEASDAVLVADAARVVAVPRRAPANSFVLHAPLELLARSALLPYVEPGARATARRRIQAVASGISDAGEPITDPLAAPVGADAFDSAADAAAYLVRAISVGDLDGVDVAARWLGRSVLPTQLRSLLVDAIVPRLSAAAHGSIFLYQLPRVAPRGQVTGELLRGLVREVAREPDWRISWTEDPEDAAAAATDPVGLGRVLAGATDRGVGGSGSIQPTMDRVDSSGVAAELLGPVTGGAVGPAAAEAGRTLMRVAARSMLSDRPAAAPYGWSHCLTLPQAVMGISDCLTDPALGLRVAATYVLGFRCSLGDAALPDGPDLADPGLPLAQAIAAGPVAAAGAVWHGPWGRAGSGVDAPRDVVTALATGASVGRDAHLVKYTLACLDAAASDPAEARLYLSAAAYLLGWWAQLSDPEGPF